MSWIEQVLEQHKEYESPKAFWFWAGLFCISAVVKDRVFLDKFAYKLYPNIYVMLHADSGLRKGPPVSMAKKLLNRVKGTKVINGRSSIQAILAEMAKSHTLEGGEVISNSCAAIIANELSASMVDDPAAMNILTDLYDRVYNEGDYKQLLKSDTFIIKDPMACMLTATNQAHNDEFFESKDVMGGFFARTFIVHAAKANAINSLMFPPEIKTDYDFLAKYLRELSCLEGEFQMDFKTRQYEDEWYQDFAKTRQDSEIKDPTGTLNRFDDSVLKVAMLLSLARDKSLVIDIPIVQQAITFCEELVGNVRKATFGANGSKTSFAQHKAVLIYELYKRDNHTISRAQLLKKYHMHGTSQEWDEIINDIEDAGIIDRTQIGNNILLTMKETELEKYKKHFEGKNK